MNTENCFKHSSTAIHSGYCKDQSRYELLIWVRKHGPEAAGENAGHCPDRKLGWDRACTGVFFLFSSGEDHE